MLSKAEAETSLPGGRMGVLGEAWQAFQCVRLDFLKF